MSYHNEGFVKEKDGVVAPKGFHYMPNGKLMSDADHIAIHGYIDKKITSFNINTKDINYLGETRSFTVSGDKGAVFSLEIHDDAAGSPTLAPSYYNFNTNTWSSLKTGLYNIELIGSYTFSITFPAIEFTDAFQMTPRLVALLVIPHLNYPPLQPVGRLQTELLHSLV